MNLDKAALYYGGLPHVKRGREKEQRKKIKKRLKKETERTIKQYQQDLIKNITPAEKEFRQFIKNLKIRHEFQKIIRTQKKYYIVDFYLIDYHTVIEIDGEYHDDKEQKKLDKTRQSNLRRSKIVSKVIRFKNYEVTGANFYNIFIKKFAPFAKPA